MKETKKVKIGEVCSIRRGASPRPINNFLIDTPGIPWLKISDASSDDCIKVKKTKQFITKEGKDKSVYLEKGSLVLSNSGTPCIPKIIDLNLCIHDGWLTFSDFNGIDKIYLYYIFKYHRTHILSQGNGSIFKNLKTDILKEYEIYLPDLSTQKKIADLLSALDDKIEINNKINQELEELGQALYTKWFINFDFPNEEGKPYKSSGGKMVESELGMIPKEWKVDKVGSNMKTVLGGTPPRKKKEYWNGEINWINSGKVSDLRIFDCSEKITQLGLKYTELMPEGTTVISITGNIYVSLLECDSCANQSVVGILENNLIPKEYIYYMIKNKVKQFEILMTGAVQKHINKDIINETNILLPNDNLLDKFKDVIQPLFETIKNNNIENKKLEELREFLIPQLMSGNLEIKDIEH